MSAQIQQIQDSDMRSKIALLKHKLAKWQEAAQAKSEQTNNIANKTFAKGEATAYAIILLYMECDLKI
ncbi:MAG: hypothetical protein ACYC9R_13055 [Nitrosotalea sp.]